jgi:hypothetical protein
MWSPIRSDGVPGRGNETTSSAPKFSDEVLCSVHGKIQGPQDVGIAKLLQIVTRPAPTGTGLALAGSAYI